MKSSRNLNTSTCRSLHTALLIAGMAASLALYFMAHTEAHAATGATAVTLSEEDQTCLACHGQEGMETSLANGKTLSLHIPEGPFASSVHASVGCSGCHADVDVANHPAPTTIESKHAFSVKASEACLQCHTADSLKEGPTPHARMLASGAPACSECHKPHSVTKIAQWKGKISENTYCLTCHEQALSVRLGNGETQSLSIDKAALSKSVHLNHECSDCHNGFSKKAHPLATVASKRERSIAMAKVCRQCHEDKFEQYAGSIHAKLVKTGNLAAPVCTDCHGSHSIGPKAMYETITGVPCKKCHANIFAAYLDSTHGQARSKSSHIEAPICADCHRAHDVTAVVTGDRLREACLGCHTDALAKHSKWLPNTALHFKAVSCPACHAPLAQRRIDLTLYDSAKKKPASEGSKNLPDLKDRLRSAETRSGGKGLDAMQLWSVVRQVNREGAAADVTLRGRMEVGTGVEAHQLAWKMDAIRNCDTCHRAGAAPFQNVTISVLEPDGMPVHFNANKDVLRSAVSVDSLGQFYAVGGTRIKVLDLLLLAAVIGGAAVPIGHMTIRRFFRKNR